MNPMSWLFIPTTVRSKADVEKNMGRENPGSWEALEYYCGHVCGLINRQHGVCKALCAKRHRMALHVEQVAAEKSRRDRIAKKRKKQRKR